MSIPDAAIEAAIEGLKEWDILTPRGREDFARTALEAAMPAIREALAAPLLAFNIESDPVPVGIDVPDDYERGVNDAGRIIRGGIE